MNYFSALIDWILPITCVLCGQTTFAQQPNICPACIADLPWIRTSCTHCGLPLPIESTCGECLQSPPPYQRLQALFSYEFPVDQLILRLKFQQRLVYARLLGELLAERCAQYYTTAVPVPAMLIPVPLHWKRLRQRGFNQAAELAKFLGRRLQIPIGYQHLLRQKYTEAQMDLPLQARGGNVKNAFAVKANVKIPAHIAVIDDVATTGHTMNAVCNTLKKAGAQRIDVWCIARTPK